MIVEDVEMTPVSNQLQQLETSASAFDRLRLQQLSSHAQLQQQQHQETKGGQLHLATAENTSGTNSNFIVGVSSNPAGLALPRSEKGAAAGKGAAPGKQGAATGNQKDHADEDFGLNWSKAIKELGRDHLMAAWNAGGAERAAQAEEYIRKQGEGEMKMKEDRTRLRQPIQGEVDAAGRFVPTSAADLALLPTGDPVFVPTGGESGAAAFVLRMLQQKKIAMYGQAFVPTTGAGTAADPITISEDESHLANLAAGGAHDTSSELGGNQHGLQLVAASAALGQPPHPVQPQGHGQHHHGNNIKIMRTTTTNYKRPGVVFFT